jgi:chitinase
MTNIISKVRERVGSKLLAQVEGKLWNQVFNKTGDPVWVQASNQLLAQLKQNLNL